MSEPLVGRGIVRYELEREVEAAGAHELDQRLDARGDDALFPAGDHGAVAAASRRQLVLGQAGAQARFADQVGAAHASDSNLAT